MKQVNQKQKQKLKKFKTVEYFNSFLKPYFEKYPEVQNFWVIFYFDDDGNCLFDEDSGLNGLRWDALMDVEAFEIAKEIKKIQNKINVCNKRCKNNDSMVETLKQLVEYFEEEANSPKLLRIYNEIFSDKNIKMMREKVNKCAKKEIPWEYISYSYLTIDRNGEYTLENHKL